MNLMALIRMFTIRFRMEGAIGVVLLLLGLLGGVGMWSMLRIYDLHQDFIQVPWQQNQQLQQMQSKLDALQLKEKEVLITFSRSANLDDSYSQWKADVQAVQGQMQQSVKPSMPARKPILKNWANRCKPMLMALAHWCKVCKPTLM